ncbi:transglutaminase [Microvirga sp. KLBC 81]|uniref:transglutaminase-like cysteine peptidase n=1 Tax=Microvirga sp. KLBC 81 TaxID=1862707 RepID=UPI000D5081DA|nr:transglutaminase-like cysteine peptidase [Microvirga sp. KLBC 81]PVE22009.1 transglutaminase [Microvirga sp. KLBC 81]
MPWIVRGKYERSPAAESNAASRGELVWLLRTVAITTLLLLALVHGSHASAAETRHLDATWIPVADGSAQPTVAWSEFCERSPGECAVDPAEPATIQLDERAWNAITAINKRVNATVSPREDMDHWGAIDRWDYPDDGYGDCEDYQLLKRRLLVEAGLPRRALRMVVVLDELGQGHAVLAARTDRGDFILDNKRDAVLPWHQTGYVYIKSEGDMSLAWVWLRNQVVVTSAVDR